MDTLLGVACNDFVMIAADCSAARSILCFKQDEDKILQVDDFKLLASAGEHGDRVKFTELIQKNIVLYKFRNGMDLNMHSSAHFLRGEISAAIRRNPYMCNMLFGGYDGEASLYFIDYLGTMAKVPYGAHGYGAHFTLSTMDRMYRPDMTVGEARALLQQCIDDLKVRFLINQPKFRIKFVDAEGVHDISDEDLLNES